MRSVFKITILIFLLFFVGCSDIGDVGNTSSSKIEPDKNVEKPKKDDVESFEPQTGNENSQKPKDENNLSKDKPEKEKIVFTSNEPYENQFQPNTKQNPNDPLYIESKKDFINGKELKTLFGNIDKDMILTKNIYWQISGKVNLKFGNRILIEAGTTIFAKDKNSALFCESGSEIIAIGKRNQPIIFTSQNDVLNLNPTGGDWKGVTLFQTVNSIFKYVQIRYAGHNQASLKLENASFDTVFEFVEIYISNNDGIKLSGGEVNLRNILILGSDGDSLSVKNGWSGKAQNIYIHQFNDNFGDKSSGLEIGSNVKSVIISNIAIISDAQDVGAGIYLRKDSSIKIINSIVTGKRSGVCLKSETLSTTNIFRSNVISCLNGNLEKIKLDKNDNTLLSESSSIRMLSKKVVPINPYSLDNWFDNYPQLYIGAFNFNSDKKWSDNWSIGMEKIFNAK